MRTIKLFNDKLKSILLERADVFESVKKVNQDIVDLDKERTKLSYQMNKLKDKTDAILKKEKPELGEWEIISQVSLVDEVPELQIVDQLEEYKELLRNKK